MNKTSMQIPIWCTVAGLGLLTVAIGCSQTANPVGPSIPRDRESPAASAAAPRAITNPSADLIDADALASAAHLNPTELENRGWSCFAPPVPNRIVCSRPNQGFPTVGDPPPADRPASFTFLVFDGTGHFVGTEVLLRTDLYKGQRCESTDEPYFFVPVIGYYECVHTAGR